MTHQNTVVDVEPPTNLPPTAHHTLANGLRAVTVRRPSVPLVELRLQIPFAHTSQGEALLIAQTLTDGTADLPAEAVAEHLDLLGARVGMSVDADRFVLAGSAFAAGLKPFLELVLDLLSRPLFPEAGLDAQRPLIAQQLAIGRADAAGAAIDTLNRTIYGDHPYAHAAADPDSVVGATRESVRALAAQRLQPSGASLVLVGDLEPEAALSLVDRVMGAWTAGATPPPNPPAPTDWPGSVVLVDRPGAVQSTLRAAIPARPLTHHRAAEQELVNLVLGGYFSSRLVQSLRERHGYAYSPSTALVFPEAASALVISADVATEVTPAAYAEIGRLLAGMRERPPTDREIAHARSYALGRRHRALSTQASLADLAMDLVARDLSPQWLHEHGRRLAEAAPRDVRAEAERLVDPAAAATVVLCDTRGIPAKEAEPWARPWTPAKPAHMRQKAAH